MNLIFKTADVLRCVNHALESKEWGTGYDKNATPQPGLYLVHDNGVYLMSNGNPGDWMPEKDKCYVAYAESCNPDTDENFYENSRDLVGGDDFVEVIHINQDWSKNLLNYNEVHIELTEDRLDVFFAD